MSKAKLRQCAERLPVTDYPDYRSYLSAIYAAAKAADASYSFTHLSLDLGLGSTNAHSVIAGRRPLTEKGAEKICAALHLVGVQKRYFLALVRQDRAKSSAEADAAFAERLELKSRVLPTQLDRRQLAFFSNWHNAAILELLRLSEASDDPEWIASALRPAVPVATVRESLALLEELGYVARDTTRGRLYPTEATVTTGNEVWGMAIAAFHRQMLELSLNALDKVAPDERDIGAVTIAVARADFQKMKEEVVALRKRYLKLSEETTDPDAIVQLNVQLFTMTPKQKVKP